MDHHHKGKEEEPRLGMMLFELPKCDRSPSAITRASDKLRSCDCSLSMTAGDIGRRSASALGFFLTWVLLPQVKLGPPLLTYDVESSLIRGLVTMEDSLIRTLTAVGEHAICSLI